MKGYIRRQDAITALKENAPWLALPASIILMLVPAEDVIPVDWIDTQPDKDRWTELVERWRENDG